MKHESKYMLGRRNRMLGLSVPKEKHKPTPIAKRSKKMKMEIKKLIPAVKEFLARPENQECKIKFPGCRGKSVTVHHSAGRTGHKLHDQADWVPSCAWCNGQAEIKDLEAQGKGVKKSRHKV